MEQATGQNNDTSTSTQVSTPTENTQAQANAEASSSVQTSTVLTAKVEETKAAENTEAKPSEQSAEGSKAESKVEAAPKEADKVPVNYDELKADKGSLLSDEHVAELRAYAKDKGLSLEQANELLKRESHAVQLREQQQLKQLEQDSIAWVEASKRDPEIGGDKFNASVSLARTGLEKVGTQKLVSFLESSKLGNHPEVIRLFARVGELFQNDQVVNGKAEQSAKSIYEQFYS